MNAIISLCFGGDPERRARTSITTDWLPPQTHTHTSTRALCWKSFAPVFAVTPITVLTWNGRGPEDVSLRCVLHSSPLHTCTAISRLINCESCSLETLNHSFSVLSRAGSLTTLTKVPPCLPNTAHSGAEVRIEKVRIELVWSGTARRVGVQIWTTTTCRKKCQWIIYSPGKENTPGCHYKRRTALSHISVIVDFGSFCLVKHNLFIQSLWIQNRWIGYESPGSLEVNQSHLHHLHTLLFSFTSD